MGACTAVANVRAVGATVTPTSIETTLTTCGWFEAMMLIVLNIGRRSRDTWFKNVQNNVRKTLCELVTRPKGVPIRSRHVCLEKNCEEI